MNDYQTRFFENLKKSYDSQENFYPDVTLHAILDGTKLPCHRIILSTSSEYFKNVFSWSSVDLVEVHNNISGEILRIVLKYIYSGEITLTSDNTSDVLCAANYFNLLEIVEECVKFILDSLELSNCIDMLMLAYQLDLSKFINGTVSFVGINFSYLLKNIEYKSSLTNLPLKLMIKLLKSNDLVFRDSETELLTRPVEREKHVLDFIISYCESSTDESVIILSLLSCVKWPILKIFEEEEFIFFKIIPHLDQDKGKEELQKFLDIQHSEWFLSPEKDKLTDKDKLTYCTRAFSCSELVSISPMAAGNEITRPTAGANQATLTPTPFSLIASDNEYLKKIDIVLRLWDGRTIVGGIGLHFSCKDMHFYKHAGITKEKGTGVKSIELEMNEHIVEVKGNSGWLIDNLVFKTTKTKTYGPYGGDGGSERDFMNIISEYREKGGYFNSSTYEWCSSIVPGPHKRISLDSVLVGITGKEVVTGGDLALANLSFVFREMLPSSKFLISDKKEYEIHITDSKSKSSRPREFSGDFWNYSYSDESDYLYNESDYDPDIYDPDPDIYDPDDMYDTYDPYEVDEDEFGF